MAAAVPSVSRGRSGAATEGEAGSRRRSGRRPSPRNFYGQSLTEAERLDLARAEKVEGLDDEIALLRVRLKKAVAERPTDLPLLVRGVELLVKAVAARYRLSPKARRDLADNLAATLNSLGDQLLPPA